MRTWVEVGCPQPGVWGGRCEQTWGCQWYPREKMEKKIKPGLGSMPPPPPSPGQGAGRTSCWGGRAQSGPMGELVLLHSGRQLSLTGSTGNKTKC